MQYIPVFNTLMCFCHDHFVLLHVNEFARKRADVKIHFKSNSKAKSKSNKQNKKKKKHQKNTFQMNLFNSSSDSIEHELLCFDSISDENINAAVNKVEQNILNTNENEIDKNQVIR
jgi:hypothetical protein